MSKIIVQRALPVPPPIKQTVVTLTGDETVALASLLNSVGLPGSLGVLVELRGQLVRSVMEGT